MWEACSGDPFRDGIQAAGRVTAGGVVWRRGQVLGLDVVSHSQGEEQVNMGV